MDICCLICRKFKVFFDGNLFKCSCWLTVHRLCFYFRRIFNCIRSYLPKTTLFIRLISEPSRRPNAIEFPPHVFQDFLPQAVAVARIFGGMIGCTIALNRKYIIRAIR